VPNLCDKFEISSISRSRDMEGSQNSKSRSRDPFTAAYDLILHLFVRTLSVQSACQMWSFRLQPLPRYGGGPKFHV